MKVPVEKNKEYIVDIVDNGFGGEGIAKIDNFTIFVPNAIKGEKVKILIVKVLTSHAFAKILEIVKISENRIESDCETYKRCGGCSLRHVKYSETLKMKQNAVQSLVNKMLKSKIQVKETVGMENPYHYRNKAQYPVGKDRKGNPVMGVFANRTHEIVSIHKCFIQNEKTEELAKFVFNFIVENNISIYDEKKQKGLIRHIVTKIGIKTNQIMCIIVINGKEIPYEDKLVRAVRKRFPEVTSIIKNINMKNTNVILGQENITLYGKDYIEDRLGNFIFKISPFSFYQVNPGQVEKLYKLGVDLANISKDDIVFDLYCGIGTISLFLSRYSKMVYGIEIVDEAIEAAKDNAKCNDICNVEFICGDVEVAFDELIHNKKLVPDILMVDPPRRGMDRLSLDNILEIRPKRIVYISCNPASLMRDLAILEDMYLIDEICPVDMFPFTSHVECVAVLELKESIEK